MYRTLSKDTLKTYRLVLEDEDGVTVEFWSGFEAQRVATEDEDGVREEVEISGMEYLPTRDEIERAIERDYEANV